MAWTHRFSLRLQTLFRRIRFAERLDDEMQFHLEQQIAENIASGMPPQEARRAALRTFGNPTFLKEQTSDNWGWLSLGQFRRDMFHAGRSLLRSPGFAIAAILVIALGIGSTTALFTVVRSVLLDPLPFKNPSRLLRLYEDSANGTSSYNYSAAGVFAQWNKLSHGFSEMAFFSPWQEYNLSAAGGQLPEKIRAAECSWNLFDTLGVEPALGRIFTSQDDRSSANATVILSWGLWKRRFAGDPDILNQTIRLNDRAYTVIGVMPAWFAYPERSVQVWTPIYHEESAAQMRNIDSHEFLAIGRLNPGVTEGQATAELTLIIRQLRYQHPGDPYISKGANSRPLLEDMVGDLKTPLWMLLIATSCVLLIACLNVASLLVARGAARRKELAIRAALGGSRWRLLAEHLYESFLLSASGGVLGFLLANLAVRWFVSTREDMTRVESIRIDGTVVLFGAGLVFLCALFAGLASSFSIKGDQLLTSLQESSRSATAGHGRVHLRKWLLAIEVALTVVLLLGAGLLLKSYSRLRSSNLGCITNNVLTMRFTLPEAKYAQPAQRLAFYSSLLDRVRSLPGVQAAALVRAVPGQGYGGDSHFSIVEHPVPPGGPIQYAINRWADPEYFAALGIPFLSGHTFDDNQRLKNARQMIISAAFQRQYFPDEDPIGKHIVSIDKLEQTIVGVVGDTRYEVSKPPEPTMYFPLFAGSLVDLTLAVRSDRQVTSLALPAQEVIQQLDPELAVSNVLTMDQLIGKSTLAASFDATLVLVFAMLSLLLAAVGLFGVLSFIVNQRTTEIGIRIALGAQRSDMLQLVLSDGLRPAAAGLLLGLAVGAAAAKLIRNLLYGVQPFDLSVFAVVVILLLIVASGACLLPAWRASRLDPIQALRNQ
ncbi:MAG: ADOP family duplicated permease [Candidatus Acidiferrum sp.]